VSESADTTPPGSDEALRDSISNIGVVHPVLLDATTGNVIDGRRRSKIAADLGIRYRVSSRKTGNSAAARSATETLQRRNDERHESLRAEVLRLGRIMNGDGAQKYSDAAISSALGLSAQYVQVVLDNARQARITEPEWTPAPPAPPEVHEALSYIPEVSPERYAQLRADIERDGQQVAIVLDGHGRLVDGRARWKICEELGVQPNVKLVVGNAWKAVLALNVGRFPNQMERLRILAGVPGRNSPSQPDDPRPLPIPQAAEVFQVPYRLLKPIRIVQATGDQELMDAVVEGVVRPGSAVRITREVPKEEWPAKIAALRRAHNQGAKMTRLPREPDSIPVPITSNRMRNRHKYVTAVTIQQLHDHLTALGVILDSTDGLDPAMTEEQAALALSSLSTSRRHVGRLTTLLKERKEAT
jgi:ParB-like chromosome segregation protein Spo0J